MGDFLGILVQPQRFLGSVSCLFLYLSFIGLLLAQILKGWWVASRAVGCRVPTIFWVAGGGAGEGGNELIVGGRKCDLEMNLCFPRRLTAIRLVGLVRLFEYILD